MNEFELRALLNRVNHPDNVKRKRDEYNSHQVYDGNLRYYVSDKLKEMYPKTWKMFQVSDYSILKKVVDKKSRAYKENPLRKLGTDEETRLYQDLVKKYSLNECMKGIDKLYNQHKYCLAAVFYERSPNAVNVIEEKFKFIPLAPYEFDIELSELGELEIVVLTYPDQQVQSDIYNENPDTTLIKNDGIETQVHVIWTYNYHIIVNAWRKKGESWKYKIAPNEKNPNNLNPYGVLPFVYLPMDFSDKYPVPSALPFQTVELNAEMSTYYTSGMMQIGTLVVSYPSSQAIETVTQGLFTGMKMPQSENPDAPPTKAEYISPSPNMSGHRESIITHMSAILDEQGINSNQLVKPDESFQSGFDRLLASADVQDIIEDNQGFYGKVEQKIFKIVQAIYKNFIKRDIFKTEEINVIYKKPKVLISDTEKLANIEKMDTLGVLLPWEKFMMIDPNLSEDDAKEKYERLEEIRRNRIARIGENL
jgi:hypothetical protein